MRGESESNEMIILSAMLVHKHPRLPSKKKQKNERSFLSISATTDDSPD